MFLNVALTINVIFQSRQIEYDPSAFYAFLCYVQAFLFQTAQTGFIWHWILSMVVIYLVIVRKISVNQLRSHSHWYYWTFGLVMGLATGIPMIANRLGRIPVNFPICWVNGEMEWRVMFSYIHDEIGMLVFLIFTYPVARELHRISKYDVDNSFVLKDLMYQHIVHAIYLFLTFLFSSLWGLNSAMLELKEGAWDSAYISSTEYTYCMGSMFFMFFLGIFTVLIHSIKFSAIQNCIFKVKTKIKQRSAAEPPNSAAPYTESNDSFEPQNYRMINTPKSINDSTINPGSTAVSIPPNSEQRKDLLRAQGAYTMNLLMNVREELAELGMEESEIESFISEQSELSTTEYESEQEFSERLLAAQQRWREQTNNV